MFSFCKSKPEIVCTISGNYCKRNCPMTPSVRLTVSLSVIISPEGGKFHFDAAVGALVYIIIKNLADLMPSFSFDQPPPKTTLSVRSSVCMSVSSTYSFFLDLLIS